MSLNYGKELRPGELLTVRRVLAQPSTTNRGEALRHISRCRIRIARGEFGDSCLHQLRQEPNFAQIARQRVVQRWTCAC